MSVFRRARVSPTETRGAVWPGYPFPPSQLAASSVAGVAVTTESALRNAATWACQRVLVSAISSLPVDQIRVDGSRRMPIVASPIVASPSARVSRRAWVAQVVRSNVSAGNIYGQVVASDNTGQYPRQIETIHPDRVRWLIRDGEEVPTVDGKPQTLWPAGDFWHVPVSQLLMPGSRVALSPIEYSSTAIGTGIAAEEFGARFFGDGGHPSALIYSDAELTAPQAEDIKQAFLNAIRGTRSPAVFGSGLKYEQLQIDPKDSQFIDLLQFEVLQQCRVYGVPPAMVYAAISGQNVTYANVAQSDLAFLKYSVTGWITDLEDAWSAMLAPSQQVKFNVDALLRMDAETRWKIHDQRLKNKTTSVNRVLALEDELPFPDPIYDEPGVPGEGRDLSVAEAVQKVYLGVGTVLTADEAREIVNEFGGNLAVPGPELTPDPAPAAPPQ